MTTSWTPEMIQTEANKFETRSTWKTGSPKSYSAARRHGGIDVYAGHMPAKGSKVAKPEIVKVAKPKAVNVDKPEVVKVAEKVGKKVNDTDNTDDNRWFSEWIQTEADKYQSRKNWAENSPVSYEAARKHGKVDEYLNHMRTPTVHWTPKNIRIEAAKYETRLSWLKNSPQSYHSANSYYGGVAKYL